MAQIILNIPDAVLPRVIDGLCSNNGFDPNGPDTKPQFAKKVILKFVKANVAASEGREADLQVRQQVEDQITLS